MEKGSGEEKKDSESGKRVREGWRNVKSRRTLFWLFLGKKDYSTLSFGNMVHCSIMMTRKCGIIPKLPCPYVCSCVFAQMRTRSWRVHPSDEKERRRKWKREVQQSSGHYPDSLDVWVQLQAGWYPDASPRSHLSFSLPLDLKKAE